jgi:DNA-binding response OmpR family regulator
MTSALLLLLVEDEALLRDLLEAGLSDAGFEIALATNGTQGLARLEVDAAQFKAVITDIKMGEGPDGWEIGRRARELVSDMPVIYMSGDSGHDWPSKGVPNSVMLPKPFAIAQLITAVSTLMNDAAAGRATTSS